MVHFSSSLLFDAAGARLFDTLELAKPGPHLRGGWNGNGRSSHRPRRVRPSGSFHARLALDSKGQIQAWPDLAALNSAKDALGYAEARREGSLRQAFLLSVGCQIIHGTINTQCVSNVQEKIRLEYLRRSCQWRSIPA